MARQRHRGLDGREGGRQFESAIRRLEQIRSQEKATGGSKRTPAMLLRNLVGSRSGNGSSDREQCLQLRHEVFGEQGMCCVNDERSFVDHQLANPRGRCSETLPAARWCAAYWSLDHATDAGTKSLLSRTLAGASAFRLRNGPPRRCPSRWPMRQESDVDAQCHARVVWRDANATYRNGARTTHMLKAEVIAPVLIEFFAES